MTTAKDLQARRADLVRQRQEVINLGHEPTGVDMAITAVDRQLQNVLGDEEDSDRFGLGNILLVWGGVAFVIAAACIWWWPR